MARHRSPHTGKAGNHVSNLHLRRRFILSGSYAGQPAAVAGDVRPGALQPGRHCRMRHSRGRIFPRPEPDEGLRRCRTNLQDRAQAYRADRYPDPGGAHARPDGYADPSRSGPLRPGPGQYRPAVTGSQRRIRHHGHGSVHRRPRFILGRLRRRWYDDLLDSSAPEEEII